MLNQSGLSAGETTRFNNLSPQAMLEELRGEMKSIRDEERALKQQIMDLNEQFQDVVSLASRLTATKPNGSSPKTALGGTRSNPTATSTSHQQRFRFNNSSRSLVRKEASSIVHGRTSRTKLGLRLSLERLKTLQNRTRKERGNTRSSTTPTDFPTDLSPTSGINPQKIRSSLPTSPVEGTEGLSGVSGERDGQRKKNLKKRMIDARPVDVVHLGLF